MSQPAPATDPVPTGPPPSLWANRVSKWFGEVVALSDVSFAVGPGVTALLGPNGAGKSTMLRILCGLTAPSAGEVRVLGADPRKSRAVTRSIGLVPQQETLFEEQRALEFVQLAGQLERVPDPLGAARSALEIVELDPDETKPIRHYSKGMRQRVKLAQALVHDPAVLFLDEPLTGLDPRQRLHMVELFHRLAGEGRCVLVSSHVLEEVERLGSQVIVIAQGRLAAQGDFRAIRDLMDDRPHRLRIRTSAPRELASRLLLHGVVGGVSVSDDAVHAETLLVADFRRAIAQVAHELDCRLYEVVPLDDDLESVFRYLVGR